MRYRLDSRRLLGHHLGYAVGTGRPATASNVRNGKSKKTVLTGDGLLHVNIVVAVFERLTLHSLLATQPPSPA